METTTKEREMNAWYTWRKQIEDSLRATGMPLFAACVMEQTMIRSKKELRCAECGGAGTVRQTSGYIQSVTHYFLCDECDAYFQGSVGCHTYTVLGRRDDGYLENVASLSNRREAAKIARAFDGESIVRCNAAA